MKLILQLVGWKSCLRISVGVLAFLVVLNFYGLYTNKFYLFKPDNYIFPLLTIVHFIYIYALWFKISEHELPDAPMRNLEYALYVIALVYVFKLVDTIYILLSYSDYSNHVIPDTFLPMGLIILSLQMLLLGLTLLSFAYRKSMVGEYNFDNINSNIDSWP
jgi:hypothetical protein